MGRERSEGKRRKGKGWETKGGGETRVKYKYSNLAALVN